MTTESTRRIVLCSALALVFGSIIRLAGASQVGDCTPLTQEAGVVCKDIADCQTPHPPQTCYLATWTCADGSCGTTACLAAVLIDNRKYGRCGIDFGTPPCTFCGKYYCAQEHCYKTKNGDGQCTGPACYVFTVATDKCAP